MIPGRIEGATRTFGAPLNWDKSHDGPCSGLAIRDGRDGGLPLMESVWFPTPEELTALAAGAPVLLGIIGTSHPPVSLVVGSIPEDRP